MWGYNSQGQLGLGDTQLRNTPQKICLPAPDIHVLIFSRNSSGLVLSSILVSIVLILIESGTAYIWGGVGRNPLLSPTLLRLPSEESIVSLAFGWSQCVALLGDSRATFTS